METLGEAARRTSEAGLGVLSSPLQTRAVARRGISRGWHLNAAVSRMREGRVIVERLLGVVDSPLEARSPKRFRPGLPAGLASSRCLYEGHS